MIASALGRWLFLLLLPWAGLAQAQETIPPLAARVNDLTGTLEPQERAALEERLKTFEERKGSQIAVLMVPTTGQESIEQYGIRVAEQWRLGRQGVDDGALLIVAKNDRTVRIEVGYGLEGALNDATARRIIAESMVPRFQAGDFHGGIVAGVERMMAVVEGEALPARARTGPGTGSRSSGIGEHLPVLFLVVLFAGGILRALFGRFLGAAATGGVAAWLAWAMAGALAAAILAGIGVFLFTLLGGIGRGRSLGRSGMVWGGGGFGSSGIGGGFSGGGGSFGGGGASGRW